MNNEMALWLALGSAVLAVVYGLLTTRWVLSKPAGNEKMQEIAAAVHSQCAIGMRLAKVNSAQRCGEHVHADAAVNTCGAPAPGIGQRLAVRVQHDGVTAVERGQRAYAVQRACQQGDAVVDV